MKLIGPDEIRVAPYTAEDLAIWQRQHGNKILGHRCRILESEQIDAARMLNWMATALESKTTHARQEAAAIDFLEG